MKSIIDVFPDNKHRLIRLNELADTAKFDLNEAERDYEKFTSLLKEVNESIATLYRKAGLKPPDITAHKILEKSQTGKDDLIISISKSLLSVVSWAAAIKYLTPGATKFLVSSGILTKEVAAKVLADFTIPLIGKRVSVTVGKLAGRALGTTLATGVAIGVEIGLDALKDMKTRDELRQAIHEVFPIRAATRLSRRQSSTLVDSLLAVKTSVAALNAIENVPLKTTAIENIIKQSVEPAIATAHKFNEESIAKELETEDEHNKSYTADDPK
jgi:hypothetical protein